MDTTDIAVVGFDYKPTNNDSLFVTFVRIKFDRRDSVPAFDNALNNLEGPEDSKDCLAGRSVIHISSARAGAISSRLGALRFPR